MRIKTFGLTDIGCVRKRNEDFLLYDSDSCLVMVADGVGGQNFGDIASELACRVFFEDIYPELSTTKSVSDGRFLSSVELAHRSLLEKKDILKSEKCIATTMNILSFSNESVSNIFVGDSRSYCFRLGKLKQLSWEQNISNYLKRGFVAGDKYQKMNPSTVVEVVGGFSCRPQIV